MKPLKTNQNTEILNKDLYYKTRSLCPICEKLVKAEVVPKGNKVFIERNCPEHGYFEGLICSDKEWYDRLPMFFTEGIKPANPTKQQQKGCPEDCGLCVSHNQIALTLAIEILLLGSNVSRGFLMVG